MKTFGLCLAGIIWLLVNPLESFAGEHFRETTVVKVRVHHALGKVTRGSAVLLGAERLVTNCHVTANSQDLEVIHHGRAWRAELEARDPVRDLCVLSVPGVSGVNADISKNAQVGQKVWAAGFFRGNRPAVTAGRIVALHDYEGAQVIQVSAPFSFGASGGGLFSEDGRLIGILTFKARIGGEFHFALPAHWVNDLSDLSHPGKAHSTAATSAFWQQPPEKQPFFLRAMSLEVDQQWDALAALGEHWTQQSPMNPRAWLALETAFRHLQRPDDAMQAHDEAQRLRLLQARREPSNGNQAALTDVMAEADGAGQSVPVSIPRADR